MLRFAYVAGRINLPRGALIFDYFAGPKPKAGQAAPPAPLATVDAGLVTEPAAMPAAAGWFDPDSGEILTH